MSRIVLLLAAVSTGLFAGFCFCYTVVVTRGLARLGDEQYVTAMRRLNEVVPSVPFFLVFIGSLLFTVTAYVLHRPLQPTTQTWLIGAAAVCCLVSVVVSATGNIPLNGELASAATNSAADFLHARQSFEDRWNTLHAIRTAASALALVLLVAACVYAPQRGAEARADESAPVPVLSS
ncbi:DUF1772 domain-containing protein [Kitasatospora terrestris]|uniref:DUF1772 domain-containing protein n=1 Tax=Kitasatospora terrestris TaxID=258051 RepID=A0ABP9DLE3_9ACTN